VARPETLSCFSERSQRPIYHLPPSTVRRCSIKDRPSTSPPAANTTAANTQCSKTVSRRCARAFLSSRARKKSSSVRMTATAATRYPHRKWAIGPAGRCALRADACTGAHERRPVNDHSVGCFAGSTRTLSVQFFPFSEGTPSWIRRAMGRLPRRLGTSGARTMEGAREREAWPTMQAASLACPALLHHVAAASGSTRAAAGAHTPAAGDVLDAAACRHQQLDLRDHRPHVTEFRRELAKRRRDAVIWPRS
jgi:hypothetical protein